MDLVTAIAAPFPQGEEIDAGEVHRTQLFDPLTWDSSKCLIDYTASGFPQDDIDPYRMEAPAPALSDGVEEPRWSTPTLELSGIAHACDPDAPAIGSSDAPFGLESSDAYDISAVLANYRRACQRFDNADVVFRDSFHYLSMALPKQLRGAFFGTREDLSLLIPSATELCRQIWYQIIKRQSQSMKSDARSEKLATWARSYCALRATSILEWNLDPADRWLGSSFQTPVGEDCTTDSCNTDDEVDQKYDSLQRALEAFRGDPSQVSTVLNPVSAKRMRKDVRAWARLANYRCITLGDCSMLLFKDKSRIPKRRRLNKLSLPNLFVSGDYMYRKNNADNLHTPDPHAGYSSADSNNSAASVYSRSSGSTRPRLRSQANGYPCFAAGCRKVFNRACDLAHHERSHRAKDELPCVCAQCGKRFPYPKDLRRHMKIHERRRAFLPPELESSQAESGKDDEFEPATKNA